MATEADAVAEAVEALVALAVEAEEVAGVEVVVAAAETVVTFKAVAVVAEVIVVTFKVIAAAVVVAAEETVVTSKTIEVAMAVEAVSEVVVEEPLEEDSLETTPKTSNHTRGISSKVPSWRWKCLSQADTNSTIFIVLMALQLQTLRSPRLKIKRFLNLRLGNLEWP